MRYFIFIFLGFFLLLPARALAGEQDIVINEIAAYESSDTEWIEIFNKGTEKVDITGWKFFEEGTNHKLTAFRGDFILDPGEYAVIANDAAKVATKYPTYTGAIFDSSWSSLTEKGEEIGLKNAQSVKVELVTYLATTTGSLERKDAATADYTASNWKENAKSNTIGMKNSVSGSSGGSGNQQSPSPTQQQSALQFTLIVQEPVWVPGRGDVLINELVSDPEEGEREWIELYNPTRHEIELSGWTIEDGARNSVMLSGKLGEQDLKRFFILDLPAGFLRNSGDTVELRDSRKFLIDAATYGDWDDGELLNNAPRANDPLSLARAGDGVNTYNNKNDFQTTTTPTKGDSNRIAKNTEESVANNYSALIISEILPNPGSQKPSDEFIELVNQGSEPIHLEGWTLGTADGRTFIFHGSGGSALVLAPKTYFVATRTLTHLVLRNSGGDRVRLYPPGSSTPSYQLTYQDSAPLGMSYSLKGVNRYAWTRTPTPGEESTITVDNQGPDIVLTGSFFGRAGEFMTFDASDSDDADSDSLDFTWDFGDYQKGTGAVVNHTYEKSGSYVMALSVGDGKKRTVLTKQITITADAIASPAPLLEKKEVVTKKASSVKAVMGVKEKNTRGMAVSSKQSPGKGTNVSTIRALPNGSRVTVSGVVSVEPGVVSESYFYIAGSGIQVWNADKKFPQLRRGDHITIEGTLKKNGEDRAIRIADASAVRVDASGEDPVPHDVAVQEVGEKNEGWLVRVKGEVQKVQWPNIYLGDASSQVRIYVARTTSIPRITIEKGETLTVQGIVSQTKTGFRILPRDINDIALPKKEPSMSDHEKKNTENAPSKQEGTTNTFFQYGITGLIALLVVAGGLLLEYLRKKEKKDGGVVDRDSSD